MFYRFFKWSNKKFHHLTESPEENQRFKELSIFKGEECQVSDDTQTISFKGEEGWWSFARTYLTVPLHLPEIYYEAEIVETGERSRVGIGFTTTLPTEYDYEDIKESANAIAFCCQTGKISNGNKTASNTRVVVKPGDFVGCRLQYIRVGGVLYQVIQFSLNGRSIGHPQGSKALHPLYPSVWMASSGCILRTNLGKKKFTYEHGIGNYFHIEYLKVLKI